ncbi:putative oxidoreductase YteT precursor [Phycisphaerae bacterium RAS1]|nr:putative oxidoreductase YteT precursor [Phycisphaerae bacterium RAS1]
MFILGNDWQDGYLDPHSTAGDVRIAVRFWQPLEALRDVFLEQPRSVRRVLNYVREVGIREVLKKIRSRLAETLRDQRVIAIGAGEVLEADESSPFRPGAPVAFVAPCHPPSVERVCLPEFCVAALDAEVAGRLAKSGVVLLAAQYAGPDAKNVPAEGGRATEAGGGRATAPDWSAVAGWNRFSGSDIAERAQALLEWAGLHLARFSITGARELPLTAPSAIRERSHPVEPRSTASAVLFGLGNYAKTCILPNLDPRVRVRCIHEIDPTQIGAVKCDPRLQPRRAGDVNPPLGAAGSGHTAAGSEGGPGAGVAHDTCPVFRDREEYDICIIAGYHHTHAPLAVEALRRGATVISEKPLVTTRAELNALLGAMEQHPGRYHACFHMRYNPLWKLAREDLRSARGDPIHYSCIVFEVPLVKRHWYNWPASCSRIVSNGCHWLDHFLFMNDFNRPTRTHLWRASNDDVHVSVELQNGAVFSMVLTDKGSRRIGVQDHIQLRAGEVTVRVDNGSRYESEERFRVIRRKRINKMTSFRTLYGTVSRKALAGEPGDALESTQRSCELMLELEEQFQRRV